jgi:hypothetical protein
MFDAPRYEITVKCQDDSEVVDVVKAYDYKRALHELWDVLFRPRHKHGYPEARVNEIIAENDAVNELMDALEEKYREIMINYEVPRE